MRLPIPLALTLALGVVATACSGRGPAAAPIAPPTNGVLTGRDALGDWSTDAPGVRRKITPADLPAPFATPAVDNGPRIVPRPAGVLPKAPAGFTVSLFADGLKSPRVVKTAPNGDLFVVESYAGQIRVLRDADRDGKPEINQVYRSGLSLPFGIAFHENYLYIANTDQVVRVPYIDGDLVARGPLEVIVPNIPGGGKLRGGGHWTRDIEFSNDGTTMFVSVGSISNVDDPDENRDEHRRATILAFDPNGQAERTFASGIRNAVGLAVHPETGDLWCSVNERDGLGDFLVPDYITRVRPGGFYGWPYYYIGGNPDPRLAGKKPELRARTIVPDVLLQSHSASLDIAFYQSNAFPAPYRGDLFACEHGSWNRSRRTGYKVIRVPVVGGAPTGEYEDFLTGFVVDNQSVWGRPVGVTVGGDGALYVADDGSNAIWKVAWTGKGRR